MTPIGAHSSPAAIALRIRAQNAPSMVQVTGVRYAQMDFVVVVHRCVPRSNNKAAGSGANRRLCLVPLRTVFSDGIIGLSKSGSEVCCGLHLGPTLPLKEERDAPSPTEEAYHPASVLTAIYRT